LQLQADYRAKGQNVSHDDSRSGSKSVTPREIFVAWVVPIVAALIVTAILVIERLQVDWSADCSLSGDRTCDADIFANLLPGCQPP
jgi:hypothetical protein